MPVLFSPVRRAAARHYVLFRAAAGRFIGAQDVGEQLRVHVSSRQHDADA
jgi:hypothetical protein